MSQTTAARSGARAHRLPPQRTRPDLRVVSAQPRTPRQAPFVVFCGALLGVSLLVLLLLHTALAEGAYRGYELQAASADLAIDEQAHQEQLAALQAPGALAAAATKRGMAPPRHPAQVIDVAAGTVSGLPAAKDVVAPEPYSVVPAGAYRPPADGGKKKATTSPTTSPRASSTPSASRTASASSTASRAPSASGAPSATSSRGQQSQQ